MDLLIAPAAFCADPAGQAPELGRGVGVLAAARRRGALVEIYRTIGCPGSSSSGVASPLT